MPDYIWTESPGTNLVLEPRVAMSRFGDGYEQRAPDGLNPLPEVWDVVHTAVDVVLADEIEAFIRPGMGVDTFDWVPPRQTVARKFKCTSFRRSITQQLGEHDVSMRFERVFTP